MTRVQLLAVANVFSLCCHNQTGSGAHPTSCLMDTSSFFPKSKNAHQHLMPVPRMCGALTQHMLYMNIFMMCLDMGDKFYLFPSYYLWGTQTWNYDVSKEFPYESPSLFLPTVVFVTCDLVIITFHVLLPVLAGCSKCRPTFILIISSLIWIRILKRSLFMHVISTLWPVWTKFSTDNKYSLYWYQSL
jgi:hypothetical protein